MSTFAVWTYFFITVQTHRTISFFGANAASFHNLSTGWIWQFSSDLDVQLQESLQCDVCWKALNALVRNSVLCSTFWTFDLKMKKIILKFRRLQKIVWAIFRDEKTRINFKYCWFRTQATINSPFLILSKMFCKNGCNLLSNFMIRKIYEQWMQTVQKEPSYLTLKNTVGTSIN